MPIQKFIDNTLLKPVSFKEAKSFIMNTYKFGFRGLVVSNFYLNYVLKLKKYFLSTPTKLIQVLNFPMGNYSNAYGACPFADEYDVVLPLYHMKDNDMDALALFIRVICRWNLVGGKTVKFIIEENLWAWNEMVRFVDTIYKTVEHFEIKNGIYIKSNTGFRGYSPLEERLKLPTMVNDVSEGRFKTKIAGGVKTLGEAKKVVSTRAVIGTSNGVEILKEEQNEMSL